MSLNRFLSAQASRSDGFADALEEIRAGRKRGHWIWYVFPQLAGLGSSATSREFAIRDADEAAAYLRHDLLRVRLHEVTAAALERLQCGTPLPLLMGSEIDARKLISSMTLFGHVARRLAAGESDADYETLASRADEILAIGGRQGYERCQFTQRHLAAAR